MRECTNEKKIKLSNAHTKLNFTIFGFRFVRARMMEVESLTTYECFVCETWDLLAYNVPIQFCATFAVYAMSYDITITHGKLSFFTTIQLRCMCKALSVRHVSELIQFVSDFPIDKKTTRLFSLFVWRWWEDRSIRLVMLMLMIIRWEFSLEEDDFF